MNGRQILHKSLKKNVFFPKIMNLTLTFDPMTLTLCQLESLININHMCKYHQDPIIRSWFLGLRTHIRTPSENARFCVAYYARLQRRKKIKHGLGYCPDYPLSKNI